MALPLPASTTESTLDAGQSCYIAVNAELDAACFFEFKGEIKGPSRSSMVRATDCLLPFCLAVGCGGRSRGRPGSRHGSGHATMH